MQKIFWLIVLGLGLSACTQPTPVVIHLTLPPASATATQPTPTHTPISTLSPTPTATPLPVFTPVARYGYGELGQVAWSPDGRILAVASSVGVYLFDAETLQEQRLLELHFQIKSVAFSPDGRFLAAGGWGGPGVVIWEVATWQPTHVLEGNADQLLFSPDGRYLVARDNEYYGSGIRIWENFSLALKFTLTDMRAEDIAISPDSLTLATAEWGQVRLWDLPTGTLSATLLIGEIDHATSVAFFTRGKSFLVVGMHRVVQLWNLESQQLFQSFGGPAWIGDLVQRPGEDHWMAITEGGDLEVRLDEWQYAVDGLVLAQYEQPIENAVFSPDGSRIAVSSGNVLQLWEIEEWILHPSVKLLGEFDANRKKIYQAWFASNGHLLFLRQNGEMAEVWDVTAEKQWLALEPSQKPVSRLSADASDRWWTLIVEANETRTILLLDQQAGQSQSFPAPYGLQVVLNSAGTQLASIAPITLWDRETATALPLTFPGHTDGVWGVNFSPDGRYLATSGGDHEGRVRVWDTQTGENVHTFGGAGGLFSPNGAWLVVESAYEYTQLNLINTLTWQVQISQSIGYMGGLAFSADSRWLAIGQDSGTIDLWDMETHTVKYRWADNIAFISQLAFSPNKQQLVSTSPDGTVRVWAVPP